MTPTRNKMQLFLDSGAHSLYSKHVMKKGHREGYAFYETKEFWSYVDAYAKFVKQNAEVIDYYANVDVIFNPELSWKVLKYLEKEHGLNPVPVIHFGTDMKWVEKHLAAGYEFIGLGGLGQEAKAKEYLKWADRVFDLICDTPDRLPKVRTHGFAMTAYRLMLRYPWWSVDSATWTKLGAYGNIFVPHKRKGKFTFEVQPHIITTSEASPAAKEQGKHLWTLKAAERAIVEEWLELIGVPLGKGTGKEAEQFGVTNRHSERKIANLLFFEKLCEWMPKYPWAFKAVERPVGFGL